MAGLSFDEIKNAKKNLKKAPPPKVPLGSAPSQNGDFSSDAGNVSVTAFRSKFEQKQSLTSKAHVGSPSRQDGDRPSEESIASARATFQKFGQNSVKKPPPPLKPTNRTQSREGLRRLDNNSNAVKGEPSRKELPPLVRIGAAPRKKHKPTNLKFMIDKYKDKIVLSNGANYASGMANKEEDEDIYDDVQCTLRGNQGGQPDETYECI